MAEGLQTMSADASGVTDNRQGNKARGESWWSEGVFIFGGDSKQGRAMQPVAIKEQSQR